MSQSGNPSPAVELRGLSKRFGEVLANEDISLTVRPGTIHAIIGENGAGKSTAMKMLYGMLRPDSGEILIHGIPRKWKSASQAIENGIGMVHQHFMLAGPFSALENVLLGAETRRRGDARRKLDELSDQFGMKRLDWNAAVEALPVGVQQRIEILKLLYRDASILILDEPTAVLTPQEVQEFFVHLKGLRDNGKTILIITHKLKEVMNLSDEVTVFRAGRVVGHRMTSETEVGELATLMVGRKVSLTVESLSGSKPGAAACELIDVTLRRKGGPDLLRGLSFSVRSGEIVGIAGVQGNGQTELIQALVRPADFGKRITGKIRIMGEAVLSSAEKRHVLTTGQIKTLGMGVIPDDRQREGLLLGRPLWENFILGLHRRTAFQMHGILNQGGIFRMLRERMDSFDIRPRSVEVPSGSLSGGNQQKLIIARELEFSPRFLIAAQPTRGVDVGAIESIHQRILKVSSEGAGVLLVSSELDEILALSDRILVMYEGTIVAEFARGGADEKTLGLAMSGARGKTA